MKKLILAEKPSVAKNIADATDAVRKNGYYEGKEYIITWAFGHLLQLYDAKDYDPEMKVWRMEKFPMGESDSGILAVILLFCNTSRVLFVCENNFLSLWC